MAHMRNLDNMALGRYPMFGYLNPWGVGSMSMPSHESIFEALKDEMSLFIWRIGIMMGLAMLHGPNLLVHLLLKSFSDSVSFCKI